MTLLLDTFALIELFEGNEKGEKVKEFLEKDEDVIISVLTLFELGTFLERNIGKERSYDYMRSIRTYYDIKELTEEIVDMAITLKPLTKLPAIDCMIYATGKEYGAVTISGCKHFKAISKFDDVIIV